MRDARWQGTAWIMESAFLSSTAAGDPIESADQCQRCGANSVAAGSHYSVLLDHEFAECLTKPDYKQLDDGSLERVEGALRILIFRQSATRIEDL